jgi:hypothetical protein
VKISIDGIPEALHGMRRELARYLRDVAADEPSPYVRQRLTAVADAFECGCKPDGGDGA